MKQTISIYENTVESDKIPPVANVSLRRAFCGRAWHKMRNESERWLVHQPTETDIIHFEKRVWQLSSISKGRKFIIHIGTSKLREERNN